MRRDGLRWAAATGAVALLVSLFVPWFHTRAVSALGPFRASRALFAWSALGGAGRVVLLATAVGSLAWAARRTRPSGVWLVFPGGLTLIVTVGTTVARVGADNLATAVVTTTPAPGLALAYLGAAAVVLAGLLALVRESPSRA